jgi:nucleoside-diphosphate-sugar epimerase
MKNKFQPGSPRWICRSLFCHNDEHSVNGVESVERLEELLSEPTEAVSETLARIDGDVLVLGVAGKMGPTLSRMARRASDARGTKRRVIGVARFSNAAHEAALQRQGIETIRADLLDETAIARLPDVPNVIFMAGMKFGATGNEPLTWAMNAHVPALVARRFSRSRVVAFSTGNVYGLAPVAGGGSRETDALNPAGEYAMSCLARERMFEHFSRIQNTPTALIRLNYACEMRYGVLVDLAQRVWNEQPVDLAMGYFNAIWQGDANAMALQALTHVASPPFVLNVTGPELLRVREVCERFGKLMNKPVRFAGTEAPTALLNNARRAFDLFGRPRIAATQLIEWTVDWVMRGGPALGKPTHFESRDGKF